MLSVAIAPQHLEAALAAGELACPDCCGRLSPWGYARSREVRLADEVRSLRPRRTVCGGGCGATHVLAPAWTVPRRRDGAEVIGQALALASQGVGHRVIARRLGRPPGTVRGWLRAARRRAKSLRACATKWAYALDPEMGAVTPAGSELGDAVEAMMLAARAWTLRFGPQQAAGWQRVVQLTGGLLAGVPPPRR
jgi:transposase-like protein